MQSDWWNAPLLCLLVLPLWYRGWHTHKKKHTHKNTLLPPLLLRFTLGEGGVCQCLAPGQGFDPQRRGVERHGALFETPESRGCLRPVLLVLVWIFFSETFTFFLRFFGIFEERQKKPSQNPRKARFEALENPKVKTFHRFSRPKSTKKTPPQKLPKEKSPKKISDFLKKYQEKSPKTSPKNITKIPKKFSPRWPRGAMWFAAQRSEICSSGDVAWAGERDLVGDLGFGAFRFFKMFLSGF